MVPSQLEIDNGQLNRLFWVKHWFLSLSTQYIYPAKTECWGFYYWFHYFPNTYNIHSSHHTNKQEPFCFCSHISAICKTRGPFTSWLVKWT